MLVIVMTVNVPDRLLSALRKDVRRFDREIVLHEEIGLLSAAESTKWTKRVLDIVNMLPNMDAEQVKSSHEWVSAMCHDFHRRRREHQTKDSLRRRLEVVIKKTKRESERAQLLAQLESFKKTTEAEKWLRQLSSAHSDKAAAKAQYQAFLETFKQPSTEVQVVTEPASEGDYRLNCLEVRAAKTKSVQARRLYRQGLQAEKRREKIRLFKSALHIEALEAR